MLSVIDIVKVVLKVFLSLNNRASGVIFSVIVPQSISAMERCINRLCALLECVCVCMYVIVFYVSGRGMKFFTQLHV